MNDTTQPGYLTPTNAPPDYDDQLEQTLRTWICGVSGLPESMVLPQYTDPSSATPPLGTDWCGFAITEFRDDENPAYISKDADADYQWQLESIVVQCSFYGSAGQRYVQTFRSGLFISQNNSELNHSGLSLSDAGHVVAAPELINNKWQRRYNLTVTLCRKAVREYGIKSILSAPVQIFGD